MVGRARMLALSAILTACHDNVRRESPELGSARSYLLFGVDGIGGAPPIPNAPDFDDHRVVLAEAVDLEAQGGSLVFFESETLDLYALPYACSLAALGLDSPTIALGPDPAERTPLPRPIDPQTEPAGDTGWIPLVEGLPAVLDHALLRMTLSGDRCARAAPRYELGPALDLSLVNAYPTFVLPLPGAVVVGATDGTTTLLDQEMNYILKPVPGVDRPIAAQLAADGEAWFLSMDGQIFKGPIFGDKRAYPGIAAQEAQRNFAELLVSFVVTRETDPIEAYLVTQDRSLQRYDGAGWTELSRGTDRDWLLGSMRPTRLYFFPQIVRAGERRVATFGVTERDETVVLVEDGVVTERLVTTGGYFISTLLDHPTLGLLAGDSRGRVYAESGQAWIERTSTPRGRGSNVVVMMGQDGTGFWRLRSEDFSSVHPDAGECGQNRPERELIRSLEVAPGRWFVIGIQSGAAIRDSEVSPQELPATLGYWMTRTKAPADCSLAF